MVLYLKNLLGSLLLILSLPMTVLAAEVEVSPGNNTLQAAIDTASAGDILILRQGTYHGNISFRGKAISIRGVGRKSFIRGTGTDSVVRFDNTEDAFSILDAVRISGGNAVQGGGIYIEDASPLIMRSFIEKNRASEAGSGIFVKGSSNAMIANNLIYKNRRSNGGDPHGLQVESGSPILVNNTIVRNDSNGLLVSSAATPSVINNIFAFNGSDSPRRGRGICNFSSGEVPLQYNLFFKNTISALLQGGQDHKKAKKADQSLSDPLIFGNIDGNPRFRKIKRGLARSKKLKNSGHPDNAFLDVNGSRNDIGLAGGPLATP